MTLRTGSPFGDELAPVFSVGQVADMLGVRAAFVRRLDVEGVVQPARSTGGQRRYSQSDVLQVADVSKMADEGLTLAGIRRIMALQAQVHELQRQLTSKRGQPSQEPLSRHAEHRSETSTK